MPEEVFIIVVIAILAGTFSGVVKMIIEYLKSRQSVPNAHAKSGALTSSELERLIVSAVERANQSLADRLEAIEDRLDSASMLEAPPSRLELPSDTTESAAEVSASPRRARS